MNTEAARVKTSGRQDGSHGDEERGVAPARDRDLPRRSVDVLRDLGLSKEKIVAYHRRFFRCRRRRGACADRPRRRRRCGDDPGEGIPIAAIGGSGWRGGP